MNRPAHLGRTPAIAGIVLLTLGLILAIVLAYAHRAEPEPATVSNEPRTTYDATGPELTTAIDPWGIQKMWPTRPGGMVWYSNWQHGMGDWVQPIKTGATFHTGSDGVLTAKGTTVRLNIREPNEKRQWTDGVEVTMYALRPTGSVGTPYSGIVTGVRTNHGTVGNVSVDPCDSRALYARLRFDGYADFAKETKYPHADAVHQVKVFDHGMPYNQWIGYKHVVYDNGTGVIQELYVDMPGGGQHWQLVNTVSDYGGWWGKGDQPCAKGIDPSMPLRGGTSRVGSESGLPNIAVVIRADNVPQGMEYKQASVREVEAP